MKNKLLPMMKWISLAVISIIVVFWFLANTCRSPSWRYGVLENERYIKETEFKSLSTKELIKIIDTNKDWKKVWYGRDSKFIIFEEAIKALGAKTDEEAAEKLKEIIYTFKEGQKCTAIIAISKNNNKAMVPVLCEALKKHTLNYTDDVIVKALVALDDPRALACFVEEREKLSSKKSYDAVGEAIEKWSSEIKKEE